jgi:hypothetical protein
MIFRIQSVFCGVNYPENAGVRPPFPPKLGGRGAIGKALSCFTVNAVHRDYLEERAASLLRVVVIASLCIGLWVALPPARAQAQAQTTKSNSAQQGKTPPRKTTASANTGLPASGKPFPVFALPDTEGKTHTLAELKGRSIALYFFCGCERCQRCALTWAQLQQGGALIAAPAATTGAQDAAGDKSVPNTVIVYMGDAEAARAFARTAGLDLQQTLLLLDPKLTITQKVHALPCPRAFALDGKGIVRYVNIHKDDDPLKASAATLVTRTLEAMTGGGQIQTPAPQQDQTPGQAQSKTR